MAFARNFISPLFLVLLLAEPVATWAADPPQTKISNGQITAEMYLPDAKNGYYRSTRFDWSGAVSSLTYKGHQFYGPWYDTVDPSVINWIHRDGQIVSGPCSALMGPVNEFQTPLGWDEAKPGGLFVKIGVGNLRKVGDTYNRYQPYDVVDPGKWTIKKTRDSVEFTQKLSDSGTGYSYLYRKTVRLTPGKPQMTIEHSLRNTGRLAIHSAVYNHNFVVLDHQPPGPDFTFKVPFQIQPAPARPGAAARVPLTEIRGDQVVYLKTLSGQDEASALLQGFGDDPKNAEIVIENRKVGAGVRISGDRPLTRELLWSVRTVLAVEPYVAVDVAPGEEFTWKDTLDYYTMPAAQ